MTRAEVWSHPRSCLPQVALVCHAYDRTPDVVQILANPDRVYQSRQDRAVFCCDRPGQHRLLCAVVKRLDGEGCLVPAYPCDKIEAGDQVWPTSA